MRQDLQEGVFHTHHFNTQISPLYYPCVHVLWPTVHQSVFLRRLSETSQMSMNPQFVFSCLSWLLWEEESSPIHLLARLLGCCTCYACNQMHEHYLHSRACEQIYKSLARCFHIDTTNTYNSRYHFMNNVLFSS